MLIPLLAACVAATREPVNVMPGTLDPSPVQMEHLRAHPRFASEPFVMVNLLEFTDEAGMQTYFRDYAIPAVALIRAGGGDVLWAGAARAFAGASETQWDYVAIVRWPSRLAFVEAMESDAYASAEPVRRRTLRRTLMLEVDAPR